MSSPNKKNHHVRQTMAAWILHILDGCADKIYGRRKKAIFQDLPSTVVEIGAGTGANFRYYRPGTRVIAVEPNQAMHPYLRSAAQRYDLELDLRGTKGERLDLETASVNAVVGTLVLCSVDAPHQVVSEIRRVLKPGGRFIFIEHVAAIGNTPLARLQHVLHRIWHLLFDGCRLNRKTWSTIYAAGFDYVAMDCFRLKPHIAPISPHILGVAMN